MTELLLLLSGMNMTTMIQLTKRTVHEAYSRDFSHGFYRKLFETLKIWQEAGVMYICR